MIRARRFSRSSIRWTSLVICLALVLSSLVMSPFVGASKSSGDARDQPRNDKARKVKPAAPVKSLPYTGLPNLDDIKRQPNVDPETPAAIPSNIRSRRTPIKPWDGIRVGDPLPNRRASLQRAETPTTTLVRNRLEQPTEGRTQRPAANTARQKLNHARARVRARAEAPPPLPDDQYLQNFFYWTLLRYPNAEEGTYWNDILRAAYQRGPTSVVLSVRELGQTLFESADYAARGRSDHDYVYDLYKTYLNREPDQGGWDYWTSAVPTNGRANVRRAFDYCNELANLLSTLTPNGGITSAVSSLSTARVDPFNQSGNQLRARDVEWAVSLLNLPGRAGLNLGLSLSYSSLVWTRSGPHIYFDQDTGWPSPGFRLGFPTIQEKSFDAQVGQNVFVMIASSQRVELRQVGSSNTYEAADSSYLQLIDNGGSLLVRSTDGTQFSYGWYNREWRCTQIKDRNGNYLSINYDGWGHITTITDTLGRVIYFNYDGNANLTSITQWWNSGWHTWATFGWTNLTIAVQGFSGVSVTGTYSGEVMPVLTQVALHDGTRYNFEYVGTGQVNVIRSYRSDNVQRSYTAYDYTGNSDCPRIYQTRVWAENWTGANGVPAEVLTQMNLPGDGSHQMIAPDGTVYKEFYGSGWQKGLTTQSENWSGGVRQKWTTLSYTQDNTSVSYQTNPRVTETNIYDAGGNRRRQTISYNTFTLPSGASCSLPSGAYEYQSDAINVYRRTHVDYRYDSIFMDRHIIGLPAASYVYDGAYVTQAKIAFDYDWPQWSEHLQATPVAAIQHDYENFGPGTAAGRGNLVLTQIWDASDPNNYSKAREFKTGYWTTGAVAFNRDPLGHQSNLGYGDAFSDGNNSRNTFGYATTMTDADGFSSFVQYNFDFGATTRVQGPPPAGQPQGAIQTLAYDGAARLLQATTQNTGAYTRYVYGPFYVESYSTVNTVADEASAVQVFDGVGRVFFTGNSHPGSAGGYRLVNTIYDQMGRLVKQSNPFEINSSWIPYGDDATGVYYTQQSYDWKGRPLITTNTDGRQKYASYAGCGCAGGEVATLTDEVGRQQKVYSDVRGRQWKAELLNWDGTIYSTTTTTFDTRDQVTLLRQWAGPEGSGTYQDTTMSYDGYGRLHSKHVPEQQDQNGNPTYTTWAYNLDDSLHKVTDARGASATYVYYNGRHLVNEIQYYAPTGITGTPNVTFGYDSAGNRTSMSDGLGSVSYAYDQLSQMSSETRTFTGVGTFTLDYGYNLAGDLTRFTDATGMTINYGFDASGRLSSITGSDNLYAGVSTYVSNLQYRAWGGLKAKTDGTNRISSVTYNVKMQPSQFEISGGVVHQNYDYYDDGRVSFVHNTTDANFDRSYYYDHVGRLTENKTGGMARSDWGDMPYYETFGYDAFSNLTNRGSDSWNWQTNSVDSAVFSNNRRSGWGYDGDGRNTTIGSRNYSFDADGQMILMSGQKWVINHYVPVSQAITNDGDGDRAKEGLGGSATYYLRSSVLDDVVEELDSAGQKIVGYVRYPEGELLARQWMGVVRWYQMTAAGTARYDTYSSSSSVWRTELDPMGADIPITGPPTPDTNGQQGDIGANHFGGMLESRWSNFFDQSGGCSSLGYTAACHAPMSPSGYLDAQHQEFFGDKWYDLAGNNNERERAERLYVRDVERIFAELAAKNKKKKKTKPTLKRKPKPEEHERRRKAGAGVGKDEGGLQNPPSEINPLVISSPPSLDCNISVAFHGSYDKDRPNGPSVMNFALWGPVQGLGFTVYGSVAGGGIGRIMNDSNPSNPTGAWTVEQWVSAYTNINGAVERSGGSAQPDLHSGVLHETNGNQFRWYDHPGVTTTNVTSFQGVFNFAMKVSSGQKECEVKFQMRLSLNNGNWFLSWRPGN